jgi:heptosyltransferase-2
MAASSDNPLPTKPQVYLKGGNILFAAPLDPLEAFFSVPALRAIRHARPNATLGVVFPETQRAIWENTAHLDCLIPYPAKSSARNLVSLLEKRLDAWESIFLWEPGEVAKAAQAAAIKQRIGYPEKGLARRLSEPLSNFETPGPIVHRVRHYLNLIEVLGLPGFVPESFATPGVRGPASGRTLVVAPGSTFGPNHEWPIERFAGVLRALATAMPDLSMVLLSEAARPQPARALGQLLEGQVVIEAANLSEVFAVLDSGSLLFASDNLLVHSAAHLGLPAAVVFGPNDPDWRRPLGRQNTILRHKVECSPCLLPKCPLDLRCQHELSVDAVTSMLRDALASVTSGVPT